MSTPTAPTPPATDADPRIKELAVLLLRVGLGVGMLNEGILQTMSARVFGPAAGGDSALPYLQIVLGLALILGIFTTVATLGAAIFLVMRPLVLTALLVSGVAAPFPGGPRGIGPNYDSQGAGLLLMAAAVLWFSTPGRNPWSLDRLVFGRRTAPTSPSPRPPEVDRPAAPAPGERTAKFLSGRDE